MQHITVVSVLGQVVYDADVDTDEVILNMAQYSAGMYTVRVMTENGVHVERVSVVR
ncbi:MAG: T9SS type A sorting domain-containing protein [Bacteroidales bacterium]|nr:T9SS type A sorting domain-containing protein [Bacteroidales bacterium]